MLTCKSNGNKASLSSLFLEPLGMQTYLNLAFKLVGTHFGFNWDQNWQAPTLLSHIFRPRMHMGLCLFWTQGSAFALCWFLNLLSSHLSSSVSPGPALSSGCILWPCQQWQCDRGLSDTGQFVPPPRFSAWPGTYALICSFLGGKICEMKNYTVNGSGIQLKSQVYVSPMACLRFFSLLHSWDDESDIFCSKKTFVYWIGPFTSPRLSFLVSKAGNMILLLERRPLEELGFRAWFPATRAASWEGHGFRICARKSVWRTWLPKAIYLPSPLPSLWPQWL